MRGKTADNRRTCPQLVGRDESDTRRYFVETDNCHAQYFDSYYYDCDPQIIWEVITKHAPILAERCLEVLRAENGNVDAELREELFEETGIIWEGENVREDTGDSELPAADDRK